MALPFYAPAAAARAAQDEGCVPGRRRPRPCADLSRRLGSYYLGRSKTDQDPCEVRLRGLRYYSHVRNIRKHVGKNGGSCKRHSSLFSSNFKQAQDDGQRPDGHRPSTLHQPLSGFTVPLQRHSVKSLIDRLHPYQVPGHNDPHLWAPSQSQGPTKTRGPQDHNNTRILQVP